MAKQNINIGGIANDGTGDSLRDGAIKVNTVFDEIYNVIGDGSNIQINTDNAAAYHVLKWNGSQFAPAHYDTLGADLNVNGKLITSSTNTDIRLRPGGSGDIKLHTGSSEQAKVYIDGLDGNLKYSCFYELISDLPNAGEHHGMFAHVHGTAHSYFAHSGNWTQLLDTNSSINELSDVDTSIVPANGQVLKWNSATGKWIPGNDNTGEGTGINQNLWETITADSGTTTASAVNDTLNIRGGTGVTTSIVGDTLTINAALSQNVFQTISSQSGSTSATTTTDTLTVNGGTGITTAVSGKTLTITNSSPNVIQNVFTSVIADTGTPITATTATSSLSVIGGQSIATNIDSNGRLVIGYSGDVISSLDTLTDVTLSAPTTGSSLWKNLQDWEDAPSPVLYYSISSNGQSAYRFTGPGLSNSTDDPTLIVYRGFTYIFNNMTGASHPFALRTADINTGGVDYTGGLTGIQTGFQYWTVPMDAPNSIVYQCTIHSGMIGTITIR